MSDDEFELETHSLAEEGVDFFEEARDALSLRLGANKQRSSRVAVIRTSDRITYKRCRRRWNWSYSRRGNLQGSKASAPLWLGTGLHFAFEDFHGYRKFPHPRDALDAYKRACEEAGAALPDDVDDLMHLGKGMLDYYELWLDRRDPLQTLIIDGVPQVEVNFLVEIPKDHILPYARNKKHLLEEIDQVLYSVTLDRVVIDPFNRVWVKDYKSAKNYGWMHLDTDAQVSAYTWAAHIKYPQYEIAGCIYQQHKKQILQPPAFLTSTKRFSTSKRQKTSLALYVGALRNLYGNDQSKWPVENREFVEFLKTQESETADSLIRRDYVERNQSQIQAEYRKVLMEVGEMLDPDLPLYPNPTRDCSWDCPFVVPCVGVDSGEDFVHELENVAMRRDAPETYWRDFL